MMAQSAIATKMKMMKTFETLSGAAFMKMEPQEIAALSREELVRLVLRVRDIMATIATYMRGLETTTTTLMTTTVTAAIVTTTSTVTTVRANFDIQCVADYESKTTQDIAALSEEKLVQLTLNGQDILQRCPFKPGCRFRSLPDEYYLHILLEWLTIEDQARFDMALLNHIDRRAHLHLLRDTEHKGVLSVSVSRKKDWRGSNYGYKFNSGVCAWLESRNVFMRAVKFEDGERDIPAGFLARTGQQLLELDLSDCSRVSDAELGKLFARCPRLEEVTLWRCSEITDVGLSSLVSHCQHIHTLDLSCTQVTGGDGLARLAGAWGKMKKLGLFGTYFSDTGLEKIAEMCPNLEDVDLSCCNDITDLDGLGGGLAGGWRTMKLITLVESGISDAGLGRDVDLEGCRKITDEGFSSLVRHCEHIHTLRLHHTPITGEGLTRLEGRRCRNMKLINLTESEITDAGLGKIAEMCQNLEEVYLFGCSDITDVGATNLAHLCPKLRRMYLPYTQATTEGVASLRDAYPDLDVTLQCE